MRSIETPASDAVTCETVSRTGPTPKNVKSVSDQKSTAAWEILLLLVLGMIPLLWFRPGEIATGGDVVFPLDPVSWFQYRTSMWDYRVDAGGPAGVHATTLPFHAVQAILSLLGFPLGWVQRLSYVFWNTALCASIYGLLRVALPGYLGRTGRWIGVALYAFNPFLFNAWEAAKTSILSAFVLFPFTLMLVAGVLRYRWPLAPSLAAFTLVAIVTGSVGSDPPVLAVLMILFVAAILAWGAERHPKGSGVHLPWKAWKIGFCMIGAYLLAGLFWLAPYYGWELWSKFAPHSGGGRATLESVFHLGDWLKGISTHTSFFNVIRLQAAWDWYYTWNSEPYISYAARYFSNPLIILLGILWPVLAVGGIYQIKDRTSWLFAILGLIGILGAAGAHMPTKPAFLWLAENLPGFFVFRSPYYKFGLLIPLAYAVLVPIGWWHSMRWLQKNFPTAFSWKPWTAGALFLANACYAAPLLAGDIIYTHEKLASIRLRLPDHVWESYRWFRDAPPGRVLSLPQDVADMYRWGYGSLAHLLTLGADRSVFKGIGNVNDTDRLRNFCYQSLYAHATPYARNLLGLLGIRYLLLRGDGWYDFYGDTDSPDFVRGGLTTQEGISRAATLGPWELFQVETDVPPPLRVASSLAVLTGPPSGLIPWSYPRAAHQTHTLFPSNDLSQKKLLRDWIEQQVPLEFFLHDTSTLDFVLDTLPVGDEVSLDKTKKGWDWTCQRGGLYELWAQWPSQQPLLFAGIAVDDGGLILPSTEQSIQKSVAARWVRMTPRVFSTGDHLLKPLEAASMDDLPPLMIFPAEQLEPWLDAVRRQILENPAPLHLMGKGTVDWDFRSSPADLPNLEVVPFGLLAPETAQTNDDSWGWMEPQSGCVLINRSDSPIRTNVQFMVYSPNADRTLYISKDGNLLRHLRVRAGVPVPVVFENLELTPAEHRVEFYVLEGGHSQRQADGKMRQVTLAIRSFHVGASTLQVPLEVPRDGQFRLYCYPSPQAPPQAHVAIHLAGKQIEIQSHATESGQAIWWESVDPLELESGTHKIVLSGSEPCNYYVELEELLSDTAAASSTHSEVTWEKKSPTEYRARFSVNGNGPWYLVTQDLYDPQWRMRATVHGKPQPTAEADHFKADGYANGWVIRSPGEYDVTIDYTPQRVFRAGVWATGLAATVSVLILAWAALGWGRRRK